MSVCFLSCLGLMGVYVSVCTFGLCLVRARSFLPSLFFHHMGGKIGGEE